MAGSSHNGTGLRLAWIAGAALALSACTGPGLEPPSDRASSGNGMPVPSKQSDAGAHNSGGADTTDNGGPQQPTGASGGSSGGSGGSGENKPPVTTQDAGALLPDAGEEDAGADP